MSAIQLSNLTNPSLYERLQAFQFSADDINLSFVERLAADNAWSIKYAERVLEEYRRFLYLLCVAGHPVTPSDAVDQAWHLHLSYTRSYWYELCEQIVGRPLHHEPTKGGLDEQAKFYKWYEMTLDSYQREFAARAPLAIWPEPAQRFAPQEVYQRLRLADYKLLTSGDYKLYKGIATVVITLVLWGLSNNLVLGVFGGMVFYGLVAWLYSKQCPRCHHASTQVSTVYAKTSLKLVSCTYCGHKEWSPYKKGSNSENGACGGGCGNSGCGGCGGCGG